MEKFSLGKRMSGDIRAGIDYLSSGCIGCNIACCGGAFTGVQSAHCTLKTTTHCTLFALNSKQTLHKHTTHCTLRFSHYTLHTLLNHTLHTTQCILHTLQLHTTHFFTPHTAHCLLVGLCTAKSSSICKQ